MFSCHTCLMSYVLLCFTCCLSYVHPCYTCLMPYAFLPYVLHALCALVSHAPCALCTLVSSTYLLLSFESILVLELVQSRSGFFCFKLILSNGSLKLFFHFTKAENLKRFHITKDCRLFNIIIKKGFGDKIKHKLNFFMERTAFHRIINCSFIFRFGSTP